MVRSSSTLIRQLVVRALTELDALEPNRTPAELIGGLLSWEHPTVQAQIHNDEPRNEPTHRPHFIAACQQLDRLGYQLPEVRCTCGARLGFMGLAVLATRAFAIVNTRRLPPRKGRAVLKISHVYLAPTTVGISTARSEQ